MASAEFDRLLEAIRRRRASPPVGLRAMRQDLERYALQAGEDVQVDMVMCGTYPAELVTTSDESNSPVVLYLHGGGFVMGSPRTHRKLAGDISRAAGARVLVLDYPLAPENPFPAAIEAAISAYVSIVRDGVPASRIVLAGDSAGGGLVVSVLLALSARSIELPAAAVCISPWVDLRFIKDWPDPNYVDGGDPVLVLDDLKAAKMMYLGRADPGNVLVSPIVGNLTGLPPLLVHAGGAELLATDAQRLESRARRAGVDVSLDICPEMIHVWHSYAGRVPEATSAVDRVGRFIHDRAFRD